MAHIQEWLIVHRRRLNDWRGKSPMQRGTWIILSAMGLALLVSTGCGPSTAISGAVTYEGQPVQQGWITFLPADGKGPVAGAAIAEGKYQVDQIQPGKKTVQIIGVKAVKFARSSEEMARMAADASKRGDDSGLIDPADEIPSQAQGNNVEVDVVQGLQNRDFALNRPAGK